MGGYPSNRATSSLALAFSFSFFFFLFLCLFLCRCLCRCRCRSGLAGGFSPLKKPHPQWASALGRCFCFSGCHLDRSVRAFCERAAERSLHFGYCRCSCSANPPPTTVILREAEGAPTLSTSPQPSSIFQPREAGRRPRRTK